MGHRGLDSAPGNGYYGDMETTKFKKGDRVRTVRGLINSHVPAAAVGVVVAVDACPNGSFGYIVDFPDLVDGLGWYAAEPALTKETEDA